MKITVRRLLSLQITHSYYKGLCRDFDFVLPQETVRLIRSRRLLDRELEGQFHLLYEPREGSAEPRFSLNGQVLRLGLKLRNPHFGNITDLSSSATPFNPRLDTLLWTRSGASLSLSPSALRLIGGTYKHPLGSQRPVGLELNDADANTLLSTTIEADDERSSFSLDMSRRPTGLYSLEVTSPSGSETVALYKDPELFARGVFGIVEIPLEGVAPPSTFSVAFEARSEVLKYYIVARSYGAADLASLSLTDTGFSEDGRPKVDFTRVASSNFTSDELPVSLLGDTDADVVLFKSDQAVKRSEAARTMIRLNKNGDELVEHLPQPGADKMTADMIIHLSKPQ